MRVLVDGRHLAGGRGVGRSTRALLGALAAGFPDDEWHVVVPRDAPSVPETLRHENVTVHRARLPGRALHGAGALLGRPRLDRLAGLRPDVTWLPAVAPAAPGDAPYVLTVHDLSFERRPRDFTVYERAWHAAARPRRLAARAARVVADGEAVRDELRAEWGVEAAVVPLAAEPPERPPDPAAARARFGLDRPYLLHVGALEPRKAPELLVEGHARARERGLDAELVFAGDGRLARRLRDRPGVRVLGTISDAELDGLYAGALAVVLGSWLEGFGLPPVEGLVRGTPAVVSDLPAVTAHLGGGALRFPPGDAEALAEALLRVGAERERLVEAGRQAVSALSWQRSATLMRAVLAEAAR